MPDNILGGQGATLLMAIVIVAIALLALVGVFWIIRARSTSTFIRGGKNRQPRLAVLDATAVDTRRRLVLIRRDDVEHLIMIGGPSDIVIESRIVHPADDHFAPPQAAPAQKAAPQRTEPQPEPMPRPAAAAAQKPMSPARPQPQPQPQPQPRRPEPVREPELARSPSPPSPPQPSPSAPASSPAVAAAAAGTAATAAGAVGSIRAEAFEVLESARARVFEEPSFDEAAYEELTSAPEPAPRAASAPSPASSHTPASSFTPGPSAYTPAPALERAT
ncbi:MAG: flagellar biosynthetic protein FliO, partial [Hoeflea sp.]|nr:flagellar biosynthetic protein FliO [Hoeflea sp.]